MRIKTTLKRRLVVLRTDEGLYVSRSGTETILVREKSRALVWDWEADKVPDCLAKVLREHGRIWTPEAADKIS